MGLQQPVFLNILNLIKMKQPETVLTNVETTPNPKAYNGPRFPWNQAKLLQLLISEPNGKEAREAAKVIRSLYSTEFGLAWTIKEIEEAKQNLKKANARNIAQAVDKLVKVWGELENEPRKWFIGTREVSHWQFVVYTKGLYWLAGWELINKK